MTYNSYSYKRGVTGFNQESQNPLCLVVTLIAVYKNILHINLHILYIIYFKTNLNIQKLSKSNKYIKRYIQNNFLLFYLNCFLLATHLNLK